MVRISVRQQLSLLLVLSGAIGLAVLAIAVWVTNHDFVINISASRVELTASLKAAQVAFNLELMQTAATFITTRAIVRAALANYDNGSNTAPDAFSTAQADLEATLGNVGPLHNALVLQAQVFSRNTSGPYGSDSVLNATGAGVEQIVLPWVNSDGSPVTLGGNGTMSYPPALYPNLTISDPPDGPPMATFNGVTLDSNSTMVLGPLFISETLSLLSLTLPMMNDTTNSDDILGWVTVVTDARLIQKVIQDQRGLGQSGQTLLLGPLNNTNQFRPGILGTTTSEETDIQYLLPLNTTAKSRHANHVIGTANPPFPASDYPAVARAMEENVRGVDDVGSMMRTHNEMGKHVSVGYSIPPTALVDWIVVVEQSRDEVWKPINRLRTIILSCLFGVVGFMLIVSFPIAHWAVLPILRLRAATTESVEPPTTSGSSGSTNTLGYFSKQCAQSPNECPIKQQGGFFGSMKSFQMMGIRRYYQKHIATHVEKREGAERQFRIPGKVKMPKHWVKDETYDLIKTFNEMSDELFGMFTQLDDRVRQRTLELEQSKKAAEAANESKTMFVANVSHELKTPLNGILGMCAVSMEEDDPSKLRRSFGIIYKSGDLLLRTLNDLLTFSTNQVGHQVLTLDEKEFTLRDLETQVLAIFSDQARDKKIALSVHIDEPPGDPFGMSAKLREVMLWGDIHRILQVIINLTSNALKFTPADGSVTVVVRCLTETPTRKPSTKQDSSTSLTQRKRESIHFDAETKGTACFINPREQAQVQEKTAAPPGKDIVIEFEVRDTGPGIEEASQARIFEPFVQGDVGLSRKHSGTGLGLSICSQLAKLMRGSIGLTSTLGEGSTFNMRIPLRQIMRTGSPRTSTSAGGSRRQSIAISEPITGQSTNRSLNGTPLPPAPLVTDLGGTRAQWDHKKPEVIPSPTVPKSSQTPLKQAVQGAAKAAKAKKDPKAGPDFSKVRVLVAEDNKVNQEVIMRMLKLEQITEVTIAEDGQVALDLVKSKSAPPCLEGDESHVHPYDIIFMDVQMPNMDGLTSTKLIRECGFKKPIVALTAFAEQSNIDECYGAGMDYFLAKPIKRPQLKKVLTDHCTPTPLPEQPPAVIGADGAGMASGDATKENNAPPSTSPKKDVTIATPGEQEGTVS
ncbi:Two-component system protein B [Fulvia fulva]|uniref:histidine kinase n=1 Tax=Passalora fulva TaxID=5499 RepID=A0A9Q8PJI4_PASFU|nr:Two-component system protein B [Fulvia fulva]KAK4612284.1 Two-component system protein B [Fulvia fulva]KAK4612357.1 Two-component system protein B [Fulvia fulva]UJO23552.1 Two-component system protein B [Fulvia fulva]WPV21617.1 Two-component system protein B [Fulvia fulva]WPV36130.1 Two-component system protein B [Fulvia fulva]